MPPKFLRTGEKERNFFCRSKPTTKRLNVVEVIEFDAKPSSSKDVKKVRFVDRKEVVESNIKVIRFETVYATVLKCVKYY